MTHSLLLSAWLKTARMEIDALDARLLAQHVLGLSHAELICRPETSIDPTQQAILDGLLARRVRGEPLAYLVGKARFRSRTFTITPDVLVPRPETEELAGHAINTLAALPAANVLDLGCGSGIIAISIALECPQTKVTGVDLSNAALAVARANAATLAAPVEFRKSDWFSALAGRRFHLIVANPPYIAAADPCLAGDGLRFEPRLALTDEGDGLSCLRAIIRDAPHHLESGGYLLCEHGHAQGKAVRQLLADAGFATVQSWLDLSGNERFSGGKYG
ncbi:MAG: peptide chain release factor N(5)-glutamine methyltransferase [Betaproteobacteria bacterium]|nr:peptide chain release factor N(5)-glutamine methyltransferase [Betaproteobacteria bacterium]